MLSRTLMTIIYMPLRVAGLLLRKFSRFNLLDSYHLPRIGVWGIYVSENSINKFSSESVRKDNWGKKTNEKINFTIRLNSNVNDGYEHQKIGIPKNSWFVCLHVRGSGFHGDKGRRKHRNPNILNYIPAIKEITSRGGWVVRMGDNTMTPLPNMENVIDYPFTKYKSEFMDLCLIQNCRFFIGTQSGLVEFAKLDCKNTLLTNIYAPTNMYGRGILQHLYSKRDKRYLSIKELLSVDLEMKNFSSLTSQTGVFDDNYVYTENSEEEISKAVLESMGCLSNNNFSLTSKQKEYNEYRKKQGYRSLFEESKRFTSPRTHNDEEEIVERYIIAGRVEAAQGTLCAGFLEKNLG
jgi:putative glycosyltransferase (TIGR04372 family)